MKLIETFLFFLRTDLRNKVNRRLARLRSPRYAIALLVGIAYFYFIFDGESLFRGRAQEDTSPGGGVNVLIGIAPFFLAILAAKWWLGGGARHALAFLPAEVNILFTAPLTRKQLIQFKLLRAQPALLFSALFFTLIMRGSPAPWWLRLPAVWLLLSTVHLHQLAAELVHSSARQHGRAGWRRMRVAVVLFALGIGSLVWSLVRALPQVRAAQDGEAAFALLRNALVSPPANIALAPFRLLVAPLAAGGLGEWLVPFTVGLLVLIAHYLWVVRLDVAFEESAAEAGARVAAMAEAMRAGRRVNILGSMGRRKVKPPWFSLRPQGEPAVAILWKNVLYFTRNSSAFLAIAALVVATLFGVVAYVEELKLSAAFLASGITLLVMSGVLFFFGPLAFRNDLRMDLKKIELLRTLPLNGTRMVAAQLASSTTAITTTQFALLIPGVLLLLLSGGGPENLVLLALLALLAFPALNAIALGIQNGLALAFPVWTRIGAEQVGGIEHMGQQIMTMVGAAALLMLALVPALLVGAVCGAALFPLFGRLTFIPGAFGSIAALYAEVFLLIGWLGGMYDRLDPVEAGLCR